MRPSSQRPSGGHWRLILAAALGAASVAGFAPLAWFPLPLLALAGVCLLLAAAPSALSGAWLGFAFGLGFFGSGVSWVYVSLSVFGGMPAAAAGGSTFAFCALLALFPAAVGALAVRLAPAAWPLRAALFAALWTLAEWARGTVFTGFPWLSLGYSQTPPSPLAGLAPLLGVYGVGLVTALIAALVAEALLGLRSGQRRRALLALGVVVVVIVGGGVLRTQRWTSAQGEPLSVALLQGNVAQEMKWRPETFAATLNTYHRLALEHPAQLTVLPETALPVFYEQAPADYLAELKRLAARADGDVLFGVVSGSDDGSGYTNSAVSLGVSPTQRYAKSHLVPFGEFTPPGFAWFMRALDIPLSDFTPGPAKAAPLAIAGQQVAVNICYEDVFGSQIIGALPQASLLVNLSNVAWFGDSLAPAQHLQIAQMRALESGRMMLRATNTGMTAIVGVDGRVQAALPAFTRDALTGEVQGDAGSTPYVRWGDWPALLLAALLLALALARRGAR